MKYKHVAISPTSFDKLDKLATDWDMDYKEFMESAIDYFRLTGEDPKANRKDNIVKSMKELQNTFISFIRTHEKDHLLKLVQDFETTRKSLEGDSKKTGSEIIKELRDFMFKGVEFEGKEKTKFIWSVMSAFNSATSRAKELEVELKKRHDETLKSVDSIKRELSENRKEKKQFIESEINKKMQEVDSWGLTGQKEKAKQVLSELKTLINASY
jgi:hypothetical protein